MDVIKRIAQKRLKPRHEEDMVDRANYMTTSFILATAAVLVFTKEFGPFSEPIYCWSQAEWSDDWLEYAHDFCFIESTYYVPSNKTMPLKGARNNHNDRISYYQWVPFIFVLQAIICQLPNYLWRISNALSSKRLPSILNQAHKAAGKDCENNVAAGIARHLASVLLDSDLNNLEDKELGIFCKFGGILIQNTLSFIYLLMKCLFLFVNIGQLIFISLFLGANKTPFWGIQMFKSFITYGSAWEHNGLFPRVSLCDFKIRMLNDLFANFTVQCVLMANYEFGPFSEPIYCWSQAEWSDDWLEYAHDFCFIESTYYVPSNKTMPLKGARNNHNDRISYYQMFKSFITYGSAWEHNGLFPRISLCDFKIRMLNDLFANFTVQCVLMANYLNEKIFFLLYYWFALMTVLTFLNTLRWFWLLFRPSINYFQKQVELSTTQIFFDQIFFQDLEELNNQQQKNYNLNISQFFETDKIFKNKNKGECQSPSTLSSNSQTTTMTTATKKIFLGTLFINKKIEAY
uniref:Innexin n=1 Tax=Meloidogyne incognita TaxID=6306 RepID=A0A914LL09_MELIC